MGKVHFVVAGRILSHRGGSEGLALAFQGLLGLSCLVTRGGTPAHPGVRRWLCPGNSPWCSGYRCPWSRRCRCPWCCTSRLSPVLPAPGNLLEGAQSPLHSHPRCCRGALFLPVTGRAEFCPVNPQLLGFFGTSLLPQAELPAGPGVCSGSDSRLFREQLEYGISPGLSTQPADICGSQFPQSALARGTHFYCTLHPFRTREQRRNASFSGVVGIVGSDGYANLPA